MGMLRDKLLGTRMVRLPLEYLRRRRRIAFSLLTLHVYAAALVTPLLHALQEAREPSCPVCLQHRAGGPLFLPNCGEGCPDPTHHHHHDGHDCGSCAICQQARGPAAAIELPDAAPVPTLQAVAATTIASEIGYSAFRASTPIRGPPDFATQL